jgi:hypothetical protein
MTVLTGKRGSVSALALSIVHIAIDDREHLPSSRRPRVSGVSVNEVKGREHGRRATLPFGSQNGNPGIVPEG